jgi:O-antigen/teichoic acid export membrane protein
MFHLLLTISFLLNLGISKSIVISINNFPKYREEVAFEGVKYTLFISFFIFFFLILLLLFFQGILGDEKVFLIKYCSLGIIISLFYLCFEGIFLGNEKFKFSSLFNFIFYSLALSVPSLILIFYQDLSLENLIIISLTIKLVTIMLMMFVLILKGLIKKNKKKLLLNNLKKNSKWLTSNSILDQFYYLLDKYLIKIFLGPVALATYSIPQQIMWKLSVISKGFSNFLLPLLSKKNSTNDDFNTSLNIFLRILPVIMFSIFPFYTFLLKIWLGSQFNQEILYLTKIFSLSVLFSCGSHILVTKFEASKILKQNIKFESYILPFFLISIFLLIINSLSLVLISLVILTKEFILLILRMNFLRMQIKNVNKYYYYITIFLMMLFFSIYNQPIFFILEIIMIINILLNYDN